jgi:serine/threonine-protein kinase
MEEEDDGPIGDLVQAVLDGTPIDWPAAESAGHPASWLLKDLRLVETIARAQRDWIIDVHPQPDEDLVGSRRWGHLRITQRIGGGAFGEVHRAWDSRLERDVALKLFSKDVGSEAADMLREARLLARIRHPNVVTIYGADLFAGQAGLWMELVPGRTLESLLQSGETFPPQEVARIGLDLARALNAVHEAGLLHRDVKAQNVMRADDGRIVLMDFGAGLRRDESHGSVAGTPLYLAPEILRGARATAQGDVYSLGVLLFHLLTRSFPVQGTTLDDLRRAHEEPPANGNSLGSEVPASVKRVVMRAIDSSPALRYPDVASMAADLQVASAPPRRRWPWVAAATSVIAGMAAVMWLAPERPLVGVLPFELRGGDAASDVLAAGLTMDLSQRLAQLDGLTVRSAPSSPRPNETTHDLQAWGRALGVKQLLLGAVTAEAGTIRQVDASLVRTTDGKALWAGTFVPKNDDLFAVREQIAIAVGTQLGLRFARGRKTHQTEPGLQRLFYSARALRGRRDSKSKEAAVILLEQIHRLDPSYVPVMAALARVLLTNAADQNGEAPLDSRAEPLALEAYARDPSWPDANAARGLLCAYEHDWDCARLFFEEAIRLDPALTENHSDFVLTTLLPLGRAEEALHLLERASVEDSMSLELKRTLALLQIENGLYEKAIDTSKAIMAEDPGLRYVDQWFGRALYLSGRTQEALDHFTQDRLRDRLWMYRAYVLAVTGRQEEAASLLAQHPEVDARHLLVYAGLGDRERAFDALRRAAALDPWRAVTWMQRPEMAWLRGDPRYEEIKLRLLQPRRVTN